MRRRRGPSPVWLIPVVAVVLGLFLAYRAWSEQGPQVEITFQTAEGLEAGKTKVRHKDVEVGEVESVAFKDGLKRILVTAAFNKDFEPYLNENTKFWVVRPRVGAGGVSGLSTLRLGCLYRGRSGGGRECSRV